MLFLLRIAGSGWRQLLADIPGPPASLLLPSKPALIVLYHAQAAGGSKPASGALEKYSGVKVKVGGRCNALDLWIALTQA